MTRAQIGPDLKPESIPCQFGTHLTCPWYGVPPPVNCTCECHMVMPLTLCFREGLCTS